MPKILLIDDSWLTRRGLGNILSSEGHEILEAENGELGIASAIENTPDCIFLDLLMPEIDGFEVLKTLRGKNIQIPIIVFTADIQDTS